MYNFLKLLCSFLIISNIGCSKFTNYSDDVYIERYSSNKEKFKDLVSRVKIVSDSVFLHDSSKSKEATVYHKSLIWYDKHDKRLNKKTRLLSKELDISKITQYSDSSIAFEYSFWHDKYLIYYMQGKPDSVVSSIDSYEIATPKGRVAMPIDNQWYIVYRWDNTVY